MGFHHNDRALQYKLHLIHVLETKRLKIILTKPISTAGKHFMKLLSKNPEFAPKTRAVKLASICPIIPRYQSVEAREHKKLMKEKSVDFLNLFSRDLSSILLSQSDFAILSDLSRSSWALGAQSAQT